MKYRVPVMMLIVILIVFHGIYAFAAQPVPIAEKKDACGVYTQILPRVELLAGVLSQTTWIERRGPKGEGNLYFRELRDFFSRYKDHEAVKIAQQLTDKGFTYDAPANFILRLGPLPALEAPYGYSDYLIGRAGSEEILEKFRLALKDLAEVSNFLDFYTEHLDQYNSYISSVTADFHSERVLDWLQRFFGWEGEEYRIVLAPAMFPTGGYGANIDVEEGKKIIFQVVRESGRSSGEPQFQYGIDLEMLALHEWGHSFVNPSLDAHPQLIKRLEPLYSPVKKKMRSQAYGTLHTFFGEQVLRAVTTIAVEELYGKSYYNKELTFHEGRGFYLTQYTIEQLKYYAQNRDKFPTFKEFVPYLLEQYYRDMDELVPTRYRVGILVVLIMAAVVTGAVKLSGGKK